MKTLVIDGRLHSLPIWAGCRCPICGVWSQYKLKTGARIIRCWGCRKYVSLLELQQLRIPSIVPLSEYAAEEAERMEAEWISKGMIEEAICD